jgi:hypothetical protein
LYWTQQEEDSSGNTVFWGPNDVLNGGLFTDDIIHTLVDPSSGNIPTFNGVVNYNDSNKGEAAAVAAQLNVNAIQDYVAGGIAAEFPNCTGNLPQYASNLKLPPDDSALKAIAQDGQGDYYYGRTCIYLQGNQYYVYNLYNGVTNDNNGNPKPLPENGVIYVDGKTDKDGQSLEDNSYNPDGSINEANYDPAGKFNTSYGNVFVSGTLSGQLTIVAANNIYLTAADPTNLTNGGSSPDPADVNGSASLVTYSTNTQFGYSNTGATTAGTDMLGLVANNYVMILRWGWPTSTGFDGVSDHPTDAYTDYSPYLSSTSTVNLNAAILAINYGFEYESYWPTPVGATNLTTDCSYPYNAPNLQITGSIIQKYRGAVAGGDINYEYNGPTELGNGFVKQYYYDDRMQSEMPPYFLQPANSGWGTYGWYMPGTSNNIIPTFSKNPSTPQIPPYNPSSPNTDQWSQAKSNGITVTPINSTVGAGSAAVQMSAVVKTAKGDYNTPQTVTWSLSDPNSTGTTIDADTGLLTAGGTAGTVTVTAKANGSTTPPVTGSTTITVTVN